VAAPFALAAAATPSTDPLAGLESGKWIVKTADVPERALCLGDPAQLVRLEHPAGDCRLETLASGGSTRIVQYSCPGHGYGHTTLRIETPRVATIDTQGLSDGRPFSYRAIARKVGPC
jgi:hypothetical protein